MLNFLFSFLLLMLLIHLSHTQINSFIHCYVGVRKVTTLYDLELAICKNEGVGLFEELELGPLVRHPLVVHYFSVIPDVKKVFRITSEDIISYLHEYLKTHQGKEVKVEALLDFIAEKQSQTSREKLNVRIQSLGYVDECCFQIISIQTYP